MTTMAVSTLLDDDASIRTYASFGYLPSARAGDPFAILQAFDASFAANDYDIEEETAVREAQRVLSKMAETGVAAKPRAQHVVLLSGGLDSRAVLGSLLQGVDPSRITACTYGYAGNEELELATQVARAAGVRHQRILIPDTEWSTEELVNSALDRSFPPSFIVGARFQNYRIYKAFGDDCVFWDGFLGDAMSGSHLKQPLAPTAWGDAVDFFAGNVARLKLAPPGFDYAAKLPANPLLEGAALAYDDQLDVAVRQTYYIANRIPGSYNTVTPFALEQSWRFWLGLPRHLRYKQVVYKQALGRAFPGLYAIPATNGRAAIAAPGWRKELTALRRRIRSRSARLVGRESTRNSNPHRRTGNEMRENKRLRTVVSENIADLHRRGVVTWLDPAALWAEHLSGAVDHTERLRVLTSLEICLKIEEAQGRSFGN